MMLAYHSAHAKQFLRMKVWQRKLFQQSHMNIAQEMMTMFNDYPDIPEKIVTDDESCVYGFDVEIKAQ